MPKILDPINFGIEQQHLTKNIDDAGNKDADNDAVDPRVAHKGRPQRTPERQRERDHQRQKPPHPYQEAARAVHEERPDRLLIAKLSPASARVRRAASRLCTMHISTATPQTRSATRLS